MCHDHDVLVDDVVRRNRWRIALLTAVAVVNYMILTAAFVNVLLLTSSILENDGISVQELITFAGVSLAIGAASGVSAVVKHLRSIHRRTLAELGAVPLSPGDLPIVDNLLYGLSIAAGTPRPAAALVADDAPNALAVGRRPADTTIVVTSGLIEKLSRDELEAVLAAEMWAIRRYDTAMQTVTLSLTAETAAIVILPTMAVAEIVRNRLLRNADFGADTLAVATTRHPDALRRAIEKLRDDPAVIETLSPTTAPLWFEPIPTAATGRPRTTRTSPSRRASTSVWRTSTSRSRHPEPPAPSDRSSGGHATVSANLGQRLSAGRCR
jgi:heat shock protein HtpX